MCESRGWACIGSLHMLSERRPGQKISRVPHFRFALPVEGQRNSAKANAGAAHSRFAAGCGVCELAHRSCHPAFAPLNLGMSAAIPPMSVGRHGGSKAGVLAQLGKMGPCHSRSASRLASRLTLVLRRPFQHPFRLPWRRPWCPSSLHFRCSWRRFPSLRLSLPLQFWFRCMPSY